jgi:hypothetical protein
MKRNRTIDTQHCQCVVNYGFDKSRWECAVAATSNLEANALLAKLTVDYMERFAAISVYIFADGAARGYYFPEGSSSAAGFIDAVPQAYGLYEFHQSASLKQYITKPAFEEAWAAAHIENAKRDLAYWEAQS